MSGANFLLPIYAFITCMGTTLPFTLRNIELGHLRDRWLPNFVQCLHVW